MSDFYLGRHVDTTTGETTTDKLLYDPDDLTTHGVIVGMTGSGKTGLCLDLMEEAALANIPALMIDPKGDITNALLHFPELLPTDFAPWVDPADAQRKGQSVEEAAEKTADLWRGGLAAWDIQPERIQRLKESAQFSIYTPGSDAGHKISILSSLQAPEIGWAGNEEILRERIGSTVTAILGLIGKTNIDPVRDREHILLANIFEHAWSDGRDLTLGELIMQVQSPPFEKLGVFDIGMFFPDKDRFDLAIQLNNILASPAFQAWIEGESLDIQKLLYMPDGTPRHTIFYIAHLNDAERMFFVTLLYGAVETWMRAQSGTGSLRALVYFDEIFGYLPPVGNPPSKEPMLRLLKQARAFGVGMVLATQNPVDIDYKALSNAGTWFIGKLGTDQDKQRLLDGLESAMGTGLVRSEYDRMISGLGKRVFLLRNVHEKQPVQFQTRWAMNYLAGPITRTRIGELNELAGAEWKDQGGRMKDEGGTRSGRRGKSTKGSEERGADDRTPNTEHRSRSGRHATTPIGTATRPKVPGRVAEYFLPVNLTLGESAENERREWAANSEPIGIIYRPALLAQADIHINQRKYNLDESLVRTALVIEPDERGYVRWDEHLADAPLDTRDISREPDRDARFGTLEPPFTDSRTLTSIRKDFIDWAYRETSLKVYAHAKLKVYGADEVAFRRAVEAAADDAMDDDVQKVDARFEKKLDTLRDRLKREERELAEDEAELASRKREEGVKHLETIAGLFGFGRKRSISTSMTKRRMTQKAAADVEESKEEIEDLQREIEAMRQEHEDALEEVRQDWEAIADDVSEEKVNPYKKDIRVDLFGVAWMPYHVVDDNGGLLELPAFSA